MGESQDFTAFMAFFFPIIHAGIDSWLSLIFV